MLSRRPSLAPVCQRPGCTERGHAVSLHDGGPIRNRWRVVTALCPEHAKAGGYCVWCYRKGGMKLAQGRCGLCGVQMVPTPPVYIDGTGRLLDGHSRVAAINPLVLRSLTVRPGQEVRHGTALSVDQDGNAEVFDPPPMDHLHRTMLRESMLRASYAPPPPGVPLDFDPDPEV